MRKVIVLGSTGSLGVQALEVIGANPDRFELVGLAAGRNRTLLHAQARAFGVEHTAVGAIDAEQLIRTVETDVVFNGITGTAGLLPTIAALEEGRTLALANKESLIVGGGLVTGIAAPGQIVPVDSGHSAIAQALPPGSEDQVRRLVLTTSGGALYGRSRESLESVTPEHARGHSAWEMGRVETTNSATMVDMGLNVLGAHLLFDVPYDRIEILVHRQSIVQSMVEFVDGSTIAQASPLNMRLPISIALGWPNRVAGAGISLNWTSPTTWSFEPLDDSAFPAVALARKVGIAAGAYPAVFNAANEEAVAAFHDGRIRFVDIVDTIEGVIDQFTPEVGELSIESLTQAEHWARSAANRLISS